MGISTIKKTLPKIPQNLTYKKPGSSLFSFQQIEKIKMKASETLFRAASPKSYQD
jgi:hypothetical protein